MYTYIILDGNKYVVATNTYNRKWQRAFSSQLAGNIIRLNFIDRGPGIRVYDMMLILATWAPGSVPYAAGITQTWDVQEQNLEASYGKTATHGALARRQCTVRRLFHKFQPHYPQLLHE